MQNILYKPDSSLIQNTVRSTYSENVEQAWHAPGASHTARIPLAHAAQAARYLAGILLQERKKVIKTGGSIR
jgi:hypothetical protein